MDYSSLLGKPIGPRSHFLPTTPIVTIAEHIHDATVPPSEEAFYVMHHEYMHYEQYVSWPITMLNYVRQSLILARALCEFHGVSSRLSTISNVVTNFVPRMPLQSRNWDDTKVAVAQSDTFEIGLDALIEGNAILDCFAKPPPSTIARVGTTVVEHLLASRDLANNRPHIIGVESCLGAAGLGNTEFRDPQLRQLLGFCGMYPAWAISYPMGRALVSLGLPASGWDWMSVRDLVVSKWDKVLMEYGRGIAEALRAIFVCKRGDQWLREHAGLRDASIVGTHVLANVLYTCAVHEVPKDAPAFPVMQPLWVILYLIKIYEAMNSGTLSRYRAPVLRPAFLPVPTLLFRARGITGLWLESPDGTRASTALKFTGLEMCENEVGGGWMGWCTYACLKAVGDGIAQDADIIECPFFRWVTACYRDTGQDREELICAHLKEMCTGPMQFTAEGTVMAEHGCQPSKEYCRCGLDRAPKDVFCIFRSVVKEAIAPTLTFGEMETRVGKWNAP